MARELPPLFKSTERVMLDLEKAVRRFPRYHKYNIGARLRDQVFGISALLHRAWRDKDQQLSHVRELVLAVDGLKTTMQVAMRLGAFGGVGEFEALFRLVKDLGSQSGGWLRKLRGNGQNDRSASPSDQSASILSSRTAPQGANL